MGSGVGASTQSGSVALEVGGLNIMYATAWCIVVLRWETPRSRKIAYFGMRGPGGPLYYSGLTARPRRLQAKRGRSAPIHWPDCIDIQRCSLPVDGSSAMRPGAEAASTHTILLFLMLREPHRQDVEKGAWPGREVCMTKPLFPIDPSPYPNRHSHSLVFSKVRIPDEYQPCALAARCSRVTARLSPACYSG